MHTDPRSLSHPCSATQLGHDVRSPDFLVLACWYLSFLVKQIGERNISVSSLVSSDLNESHFYEFDNRNHQRKTCVTSDSTDIMFYCCKHIDQRSLRGLLNSKSSYPIFLALGLVIYDCSRIFEICHFLR